MPCSVHSICYRIEKPVDNCWKISHHRPGRMHATPVEPIQENTIWCMQVVTIQSTHTGQCARAYINKLQTLLSTIPHHTLSIADQILHTFKEIMCVITLPKKKKCSRLSHQKLYGHLSITECRKYTLTTFLVLSHGLAFPAVCLSCTSLQTKNEFMAGQGDSAGHCWDEASNLYRSLN